MNEVRQPYLTDTEAEANRTSLAGAIINSEVNGHHVADSTSLPPLELGVAMYR